MCGPETSNRPRGGALAALTPPPSTPPALRRAISGDLAFHTPGSPGSGSATHARLTLDAAAHEESALSDLFVVIHSSGDLTRNAADCGLFRQFSLPILAPSSIRRRSSESDRSDSTSDGADAADYIELSLDKPLSLQVGSDGIIGRRVSLFSGSSVGRDNMLAEGIVGFNFLRPAAAAL